MGKTKCIYYQAENGKLPVKNFVNSLDNRTQQKFFEVVKLLKKFGKRLPEPHAKHIKNDIYELRFIGKEGKVRVLHFFYHGDKTILTNGFIKKTNKTPKNEIIKAERRKEEYLRKKGV